MFCCLDLESPPASPSPQPSAASDILERQATLAEDAQRRLNYIDQRLADAQKKAELNRQKKAASAMNISLAGKTPLFQLGTLPNKFKSVDALHSIKPPSTTNTYNRNNGESTLRIITYTFRIDAISYMFLLSFHAMTSKPILAYVHRQCHVHAHKLVFTE